MSDSDSEKSAKKSKKAAKKELKRELSSSSDEGVVDPTPVKKPKKEEAAAGGSRVKNDEGVEMIELGKMKYAMVRSFKGTTYVDIREYYIDRGSGALKPGKKGISLTVEQFKQLKGVMGELEEKISKV